MTDKTTCIAEFKQMYGECQYANWDLEGANPIQYKSLVHGLAFIAALPADCRLPEPVPEPTGNMGMAWVLPNRRIALSIDAYGIGTWAVVFRTHTLPVTGTFIRDIDMPTILLPYLREDILAND